MIYYSLIILFLFIASYLDLNKKEQHCFLILSLTIMWFLASFRNLNVGNDTKNYYNLFFYLDKDFLDYSERFEIGFLLLNRFIGKIYKNFTFFLIVINLFTYYIYYLFIKSFSNNYIISSFLFLTLGFFGHTINAIRQELAVDIVLLSFIIINKFKYKYASLCSFLAFLFHKTSIVNSLSLFFKLNKVKMKFYIFFLFVAIFIAYFSVYLSMRIAEFFPYYLSYFNSGKYLGEIRVASMYNAFICFCLFLLGYSVYRNSYKFNVLINCGKFQYIDDNYLIEMNMIFIQLFFLIISFGFNLLDRLAIFYSVFAIVYIPNLLMKIKSKKIRFQYLTIIYLWAISSFYYIGIFKSEWNNYLNYTFIF